MKRLHVLTSILVTTGFAVLATPFTPIGTFGTLSGFTAGSGNPNNAFMTTTIANGGDTITLGLQAQGRYSNPVLGNNGAGTFYATPGANNGLGSPAHSIGPTWNFDYYINVANTSGSLYGFALLYGNDGSALSTLSFGAATSASGTSQDSWNLSMTSFLNIVPAFDPNANGIYDFALEALDASGNVLGTSAIVVKVDAVPDTASTAMLLGLGFVGLAVFGIRQNRLQAAK